jgi:4-hydroxyphenylpyruvate dioxygenase
MEHWVEFYERAFGMTELIHFSDEAISTEYSALMSKVMMDGEGKIKFPINEPAEGKRRARSRSTSTSTAAGSAARGAGHGGHRRARRGARGARAALPQDADRVLRRPEDRVGEIDVEYEDLRRLGILADRDEEGYLLQIFTKTAQDRPTLFFEIIERTARAGLEKAISRHCSKQSNENRPCGAISKRGDR